MDLVSWAVVRLATPSGPVYIATDDDVARALQANPDPEGNPRVVLARSEIDAVLSLACQIAPANYLKLTLWTELHALVRLKRACPFGGLATIRPQQRALEPQERQSRRQVGPRQGGPL